VVANRFGNILTQEPETIAWLNTFGKGTKLWDVGANVGIYSLYASLIRGFSVVAFEPEAANFYLLNKNIRANPTADIVAYPFSIMDKPKISKLYLDRDMLGWACNSFGAPVSPFLEDKPVAFSQGSVAFTAEQLIRTEHFATPDLAKVDVDGFEHCVIDGMDSLIQNKAIRSLMIEINFRVADHVALVAHLKRIGYVCSDRYIAQYTLQEGHFEGMCNVPFFARTDDLERFIGFLGVF